eukprot:g1328.t1
MIFASDFHCWALFTGVLLSLMNTSLHVTQSLISGVRGSQSVSLSRNQGQMMSYYQGGIAGFVSGLSLLVLPPATRTLLTIVSAVRAIEFQALMLHKRGLLPSIPHADSLLFAASAAELIYAWGFYPASLPPSYEKFLGWQVQVGSDAKTALVHMQVGKPLDLEKINISRKARGKSLILHRKAYDNETIDPTLGTNIVFPSIEKLQASDLCYALFRYFINGLKLAVPVYVPVYSLSTLLFQRKKLFSKAKFFTTVTKVLFNISRSCIFLSLFCTIGVGSLAILRAVGLRYSVAGKHARHLFVVAGAMAGGSVLIEKKSRRIELALYLARIAAGSLWKIANTEKWVIVRILFGIPVLGKALYRKGNVLLFCCALASLLHARLRHPAVLRKSYSSVIDRILIK